MKVIQPTEVAKIFENQKTRNFTESIDLILNFKDLDFKNNPTRRLNEKIVLPNATGATLRIGTIAERTDFQLLNDECIKIAMDDLRALKKNPKQAKKIFAKVDFLLATANLMPEIITGFGKILGPMGLIPTPVPRLDQFATLYDGVRNAMNLRIKDRPFMFLVVGRVGMSPDQIAENINVILERVAAKIMGGERSIVSIYLKTTMGAPRRLFHV